MSSDQKQEVQTLIIPCTQRRLGEINSALQNTELTDQERKQLLQAENLVETVRVSIQQRKES